MPFSCKICDTFISNNQIFVSKKFPKQIFEVNYIWFLNTCGWYFSLNSLTYTTTAVKTSKYTFNCLLKSILVWTISINFLCCWIIDYVWNDYSIINKLFRGVDSVLYLYTLLDNTADIVILRFFAASIHFDKLGLEILIPTRLVWHNCLYSPQITPPFPNLNYFPYFCLSQS